MSTASGLAVGLAVSNAGNVAMRRVQCEQYITQYKAEGATVEQMRMYADCVNRTHPEDQTAIAYFIVVLFVAWIAGATWGIFKDDMGSPLSSGFMWGLFAVAGAALAMLGLAGLHFAASTLIGG